jgi:hypothetical protein
MPGKFKSFIDELNEQERRAAEQRAIEQAHRKRIAAEFREHWQAVLNHLRDTVEGCSIKGSTFEWVEESDGINVANVGLHWSRTDSNAGPLIELALGSPLGMRSFIAEQRKALPPEQYLLSPIISDEEFRWRLPRSSAPGNIDFTDEEIADEIATLLAQYADEYEKLKAKFDPFIDI